MLFNHAVYVGFRRFSDEIRYREGDDGADRCQQNRIRQVKQCAACRHKNRIQNDGNKALHNKKNKQNRGRPPLVLREHRFDFLCREGIAEKIDDGGDHDDRKDAV